MFAAAAGTGMKKLNIDTERKINGMCRTSFQQKDHIKAVSTSGPKRTDTCE